MLFLLFTALSFFVGSVSSIATPNSGKRGRSLTFPSTHSSNASANALPAEEGTTAGCVGLTTISRANNKSDLPSVYLLSNTKHPLRNDVTCTSAETTIKDLTVTNPSVSSNTAYLTISDSKVTVANSSFTITTSSSYYAIKCTGSDSHLVASNCSFQCANAYNVIDSTSKTTIAYCTFDQCSSTRSVLVFIRGKYESSVSNTKFYKCSGSSAININFGQVTITVCHFIECPFTFAVIQAYPNSGYAIKLNKCAFKSSTTAPTYGALLVDTSVSTEAAAKAMVTVSDCYTSSSSEIMQFRYFNNGYKYVTITTGVTQTDNPAAQVNLETDAGISIPFYPVASPTPDDDDDDQFPAWAIVLIVVAAVIIIAVIVIIILFFVLRRNKKQSGDTETTEAEEEKEQEEMNTM